MEYLITIDLSKEAEFRLDKLIKLLANVGDRSRMRAHITLVKPSKARMDLLSAKHCFEEMELAVSKFMITCNTISYFKKRDSNILYLEVKPLVDLKKLRSQIKKKTVSILQYKKELIKFTPHVTLAKKLLERELKLSLSKIDKQKINIKFLCQKISLYKKGKFDQGWVLLANKNLSK